MRNFSPNPRFLQISALVAVLSLSVFLVHCGDGGKAHYELEPISNEKAVELLDKAGNNPQKTEAVLARVRANRDHIDFKKFWADMRAREIGKRMTPEQQLKLLELQDESCKDTDFDEFAKFIESLGHGYHFIIGEFRKCQTALTPVRTRDFLISMMTNLPRERLAVQRVQRPQQQAQNPAEPPVQRPTYKDPAAPANDDIREWDYFAKLAGVDSQNLPREEKESIVSKFIMQEILRSPDASWGMVVCYLSEEDFSLVDHGLRDHNKIELADRLKSYYADACNRGPI